MAIMIIMMIIRMTAMIIMISSRNYCNQRVSNLKPISGLYTSDVHQDRRSGQFLLEWQLIDFTLN